MAIPLDGGQRRDGASAFEAGRLGFAVGDIHGRADLLARMLARIEGALSEAPAQPATIVFLGDYVDRGPDSAQVITRLLEWRPPGCQVHFLKGNHEAAMMGFLEDPWVHRNWLHHGGIETLASYHVHPLPSIAASVAAIKAAAAGLAAALPKTHLDFLRALERYVVIGDYAFVHAGVDFGAPLEAQRDEDLLWARDRFLADKRKYSHVIVHGHTPVDAPFHDERRIAIDTGAYATGKLTAARFEGARVGFLAVE